MSSSGPSVPPRLLDDHTAIQLPAASVVNSGELSSPESEPAFAFKGAGAVQLAPASVERDTRMSVSVPIVPPRLSHDCHTATQLPAASVVTWGALSVPASEPAFVFKGAGAVQVAPASVERATRISPSVPMVPPRLS